MISREKMLSLYTAMVKFRRIAVEASREIPRAPGDTSAVTGWEATLAGVTSDLVEGDQLSAASASMVGWVVDALRSDARERRALGAPGDAGGNRQDEQFRGACRSARFFKTAAEGKVAVHLCTGPAEIEEWMERLAEVSGQGLPLLIVFCGPALDADDRGPAPIGRRHKPAARISGVPLITVDGGDVCAVYRVASESIFRARHGRGPTLISCVTIPQAATFGPAPEREKVRSPDPILNMETYLTRRRILTKAVKVKIDNVLYGETDPAPALRLQ